MGHANARLTFHGRCLLVRRVVFDGRPVAHAAAELERCDPYGADGAVHVPTPGPPAGEFPSGITGRGL